MLHYLRNKTMFCTYNIMKVGVRMSKKIEKSTLEDKINKSEHIVKYMEVYMDLCFYKNN